GNQWYLLSQFPLLVIPVLISMACFVFIFLRKSPEKVAPRLKFPDFRRTHHWIFFMVLGFAFFSHGNSEFMVALPFLFCLGFKIVEQLSATQLLLAAFGMFIWNISMASIPNHLIDFHNEKTLI